jgi:hypothetical protein
VSSAGGERQTVTGKVAEERTDEIAAIDAVSYVIVTPHAAWTSERPGRVESGGIAIPRRTTSY